ncbi:hypothetical protein KKJ06_09530 [Xenorhabdus bovienii]|uniref:hypothetical protein n=1 Tax=Xenorhabdus bovienii TaxID=40576 RepID=UPI0023B269D2|nr:hypothetical protein [Xenorhabdus bovienii]MDE9555663.1 hypothetical protein [Xenorhabdus bovienii]
MNMKDFILNTEFKKLLGKAKDLEAKIKNADPVLKNITLNDLSYNKYFSYPGRFKIGFIIFFIMIVYMAFFSGVAVAIPSLLMENPSYEIKAFSFILSLIISAFISFSHIGLTLSGYYYGPVVQKYTNTVVFFFSLFISYLKGVYDSDFFYFSAIALCCLFIKLMLNSKYYSGFILAKMFIRVERVVFNDELDKIKGFNKKKLREYSRSIKSKNRKK